MLARLGAALTARTLAPAIDEAVYRFALSRSAKSRARSSAEGLGPEERRVGLTAIAALYDRPEHFTHPETFFGTPPAMAPTLRHVRRAGKIEVEDLSWPTERVPYLPDLETTYLGHLENRTAHARLFRD